MIIVQAYNIIHRQAADVNSIPVISWDIGCPDIDSLIIAWQDVDMKLFEQVRQSCRAKHYFPRIDERMPKIQS